MLVRWNKRSQGKLTPRRLASVSSQQPGGTPDVAVKCVGAAVLPLVPAQSWFLSEVGVRRVTRSRGGEEVIKVTLKDALYMESRPIDRLT